MNNNSVDARIADAWSAFRHELGDRLSALSPGEVISVVQNPEIPEGPHGALTFTRTGADRIRCTIEDSDLHPTPEFFDEHVVMLRDLGFRRLRNGTHILEVGPRRVDALAAAAVTACREVWEVVHPSFLASDDLTPAEPCIIVATIPTDRAELLDLVVGAIERAIEQRIEPDDDGDIALPSGDVSSWLRVRTDTPAITLFGTVIDELSDVPAAAEFIATQGLRWPGITLGLEGPRMVASSTIGMSAFTAENLVAAVNGWLDFVVHDRPELLEELAAQESTPAPVEDEPLPDPLQTILVLDEDGESLDPREIAQICHHDQAAILGYIRTAQEQYLSWRSSAQETDDSEEAAACRHEADAWQHTADKLRGALRLVVLPKPVSRNEHLDPSSIVGPAPRRTW